MRILDRYLLKEIALAMGAVVIVLFLAMISIQLGRLLGKAAEGSFSQQAIWTMLGLEAVRHLTDLIAPAALIAALLVLGRWNRDHESIALGACGLGISAIYRPLLIIAIPLAILAGALTLFLAPAASSVQYTIRDRAKQEASRFLIQPGTFRIIDDGAYVIYVGDVSADSRYFLDVFLHSSGGGAAPQQTPSTDESMTVLRAARAHLNTDPQTGIRHFVLESGTRYDGTPGTNAYQISYFGELRLRVDAIDPVPRRQRRKALRTATIFGSDQRQLQAEFQRRISSPIVVVIVLILAPLLARSKPREGRSSRIVIAVLVYAIYNNLLTVAEAWYANGTTPSFIGLWWVHVLFFCMFAIFFYRAFGRIGPRTFRRS